MKMGNPVVCFLGREGPGAIGPVGAQDRSQGWTRLGGGTPGWLPDCKISPARGEGGTPRRFVLVDCRGTNRPTPVPVSVFAHVLPGGRAGAAGGVRPSVAPRGAARFGRSVTRGSVLRLDIRRGRGLHPWLRSLGPPGLTGIAAQAWHAETPVLRSQLTSTEGEGFTPPIGRQ